MSERIKTFFGLRGFNAENYGYGIVELGQEGYFIEITDATCPICSEDINRKGSLNMIVFLALTGERDTSNYLLASGKLQCPNCRHELLMSFIPPL